MDKKEIAAFILGVSAGGLLAVDQIETSGLAFVPGVMQQVNQNKYLLYITGGVSLFMLLSQG